MSSDFKRFFAVDLPFACDAMRAHLIDKLLSPSIKIFFFKRIDSFFYKKSIHFEF
jgi:hypothetical protein